MKCNKCRRPMYKADRRDEMDELNDDATDGQISDYLAAELSGDNGAWNLGIVEYHCSECRLSVEVVSEQLASYDLLIKAWHDKSAEGDTFSRFVFQYLAFIAHVKHNLFYDAPNDRIAIQKLKRHNEINHAYLRLVSSDDDLANCWHDVMTELETSPLHNSSRDFDYPEVDGWWNVIKDQKNTENGDLPKGRVLSIDDWCNMVEYWYSVRNNLFHGAKNPNTRRDAFLVEQAFTTLRPLMDMEISKL